MNSTLTRYAGILAGAIAMLLISPACKKKEKMQEPTPMVQVAHPLEDSVMLHFTLPGIIKASAVTNVVARVNGLITTQLYADGQYVTAGTPLFSIEPTVYADQVETAKAALAKAEADCDYYSQQTEAMRKAFAAEAVSEMDLNQSVSNMLAAQAAIRQAKAQLQTARTNLGYCTVTAPVSGHITSASTGAGNVVNGAAAPVALAQIYSDDVMHAEFQMADSKYQQLLANTGGLDAKMFRNVPLKFDVDLPQTYTTDLYYTTPGASLSTGTFSLYGKIANPGFHLKEGMFVSVILPFESRSHAILIHDASIATDQLGKYVYLVNDSNKVVYTPIEVGELYHDTLRVVTKGLKPTDRYVTKALLTVRPGETVKPQLAK